MIGNSRKRGAGIRRAAESHSEDAVKLSTPQKRVLVIDDECHIANTLAAMLHEIGYETVAAYDAISGLAQCENWAPDLIITDVVMPGMNGVEVGLVARQLYPHCKILLLSEVAMASEYLNQARQIGYDFELVEKPVPLSALLTRVAALVKDDFS
jgi:CheY-like chemotaxis protein